MTNNKYFKLISVFALLCSAHIVKAQQAIYVAPSGTLYTHPNAEMAIFGNLINDAQGGLNHNNGGEITIYRRAAHGTGSSRIYDGPSAPTPSDNYNAGGAFVRIYSLITDNNVGTSNPSGTIINTTSGSGEIQIEQEVQISKTHAFVNGMVWTPRADWKHAFLHFEPGAFYLGVAASNSTGIHVDGYVAKSGPTNFTFPIGDGIRTRFSSTVSPQVGTYKSAYFAKNAQLGTTGISGPSASTGPLFGGITKVNTTEFWDIDGTSYSQFGLTALNTVSGYSEWASLANFSNSPPSEIVITAFDPWENLFIDLAPTSLLVDGSFTTTIPTHPDAGIISPFSAYTWAVAPVYTLPLHLKNFTANKIDCQAVLKWTTETEDNTDYFEVQRAESATYETLARIDAQGSASLVKEYSYTDVSANRSSEPNLYRLKMVDIDGRYTYSPVRSLKLDCSRNSIDVVLYPNPATELVTIRGSALSLENNVADVKFYNSEGRLLHQSKVLVEDGKLLYSYDVSSWSAGLYYIQIGANSKSMVQREKFIKE